MKQRSPNLADGKASTAAARLPVPAGLLTGDQRRFGAAVHNHWLARCGLDAALQAGETFQHAVVAQCLRFQDNATPA
ncbi:MAG: hypothetical protein Q8R06_21720 [Polaromonas sp.]|uniref:hypothetical protein n=1 Tax=Polaromonas sp. TaxID=1869339 RepID=UPI002732A89F|nr:hypothetical protein [Polaromonas sp.]MDP3799729.1 hypothetical protein [Polaromonas sp.]